MAPGRDHIRFKIGVNRKIKNMWHRHSCLCLYPLDLMRTKAKQGPILAPVLRVNGQKSACTKKVRWTFTKP